MQPTGIKPALLPPRISDSNVSPQLTPPHYVEVLPTAKRDGKGWLRNADLFETTTNSNRLTRFLQT